MIAVTGATGQLGRLVMDELLQRVPAASLRAAVRSPEKAADLAAQGVDVRRADFDEPQTLKSAFEGVERLLIISTQDLGRREAQHRTAIDAAKEAGVQLIAYTSLTKADTTVLGLGAEHAATEEALRRSGVPYAVLRNNWYHENNLMDLAGTVERGVLAANAGDGLTASATRADYAAAAATVLTGEGHRHKTYELTGDVSWSFSELAAEISRQTGKPVSYQPVPDDAFHGILTGAGLPAPVVNMIVDSNAGIRDGALSEVTGDLRTLIGRPSTPLADAVRTALGEAGLVGGSAQAADGAAR